MYRQINKDSITRTVQVARTDGRDLSEADAIVYACAYLEEKGELAGDGGDWTLTGSHRLRYDLIEVVFEA